MQRTFHGYAPRRRLYHNLRRHDADHHKGFVNALGRQARIKSFACAQVSKVIDAMWEYKLVIGGIIDRVQVMD